MNKKNLIWVIGGVVLIIIIILSVWLALWLSVPYDTSDPEVQQKLVQIEDLREDIKDEKNIVNSYIQIGHLYNQLGDYRRELASYKKLAKIRPQSSPPFIAMGQFYRERGEFILSEKNLLIAMNNDPDNVSIYQDLNFLYIYHPELVSGRDSFESKMLDTINEYPNIKPNLIQILAFYFKEIDNKEKARDYLIQLFDLAPERSSDWQTALNELNE